MPAMPGLLGVAVVEPDGALTVALASGIVSKLRRGGVAAPSPRLIEGPGPFAL